MTQRLELIKKALTLCQFTDVEMKRYPCGYALVYPKGKYKWHEGQKAVNPWEEEKLMVLRNIAKLGFDTYHFFDFGQDLYFLKGLEKAGLVFDFSANTVDFYYEEEL